MHAFMNALDTAGEPVSLEGGEAGGGGEEGVVCRSSLPEYGDKLLQS